MKEEFKYNGLEIFCNRVILILAIIVTVITAAGFAGLVDMDIVSTINVFLIALVNLLNAVVFRRKNHKISILLFITGVVIICILIAGLVLSFMNI